MRMKITRGRELMGERQCVCLQQASYSTERLISSTSSSGSSGHTCHQPVCSLITFELFWSTCSRLCVTLKHFVCVCWSLSPVCVWSPSILGISLSRGRLRCFLSYRLSFHAFECQIPS